MQYMVTHYIKEQLFIHLQTIASTWDETNSYDVGKQTAFEMRSTGSHWALTPNIDDERCKMGRVVKLLEKILI